MKLAEHIRSLCKTHKIRTRPVRHGELGGADRHAIYILPVRNDFTYAVALHEIGHVLNGYSKPLLWQEGEAWVRARELALRWTPRMEAACVRGLLSYVRDAHDRYRHCRPVRLRLPPLEHCFWSPIRRTPEVRALLGQTPPSWLSPDLPTVPWGSVLSHPDRPRCSSCCYWIKLAELPDELPGKQALGSCVHKDVPLGVETTPAGALCGSSWESVVHLPLVQDSAKISAATPPRRGNRNLPRT